MQNPHVGVGAYAHGRPPAVHAGTHEPAYAIEHALAECEPPHEIDDDVPGEELPVVRVSRERVVGQASGIFRLDSLRLVIQQDPR